MGLDEDTACCYGILVVVTLLVLGFGYYMKETEYTCNAVVVDKDIVHDRYANDYYRVYTNVSNFDVDWGHYQDFCVGDSVLVRMDNVSSVVKLVCSDGVEFTNL